MPLGSSTPRPVATRKPSESYATRDPQSAVLYRVVERHLPAFIEQTREHGGVPGFVGDALRDFLRCGARLVSLSV